MSNRHVKELQDLWVAILKDATRTFPTLGVEFERDLNRLRRLVEQRGIRVFLEDLPAIGKHFTRCVSEGKYSPSGLPLTKRFSGGVVIPKFLRGLYLLVFDKSGQLKEDCNVEALFFVRQLTLPFKKGKLDCTNELQQHEVEEFAMVDSSLPEPDRFWFEATSRQTGADPAGSSQHGAEGDVLHVNHESVSPDPRRDCSHGDGNLVHVHGCGSEPRRDSEHADHALQRDSDAEAHRGNGPLRTRGLSERNLREVSGRAKAVGRGGLIAERFSNSPIYQGRVSVMPADRRRRMSDLLAKLDLVSGFVTAALGSYDPSVWRFRNGPGAVSEYRGPTNKYCWNNWSDTLESVYPIADYGFHSYSSWARRLRTSRGISSHELPSRMVCVPKTFLSPRLIACEPSANQYCQQNLWHYFRIRSNSTWIRNFVRFDDQRLNQELCLKGSKDGSTATLDLSSASDRVTCHAVLRLFRSNPGLLEALRATRTQTVSQNVTAKVAPVIRLRKFSTMGNAVTFPVETLLFLSITLAAVLTERRMKVTQRNIELLTGQVAIFGDDIVVPSDSRALLVEALEVLDFKVNAGKSFWTGKFRESCGVDAYDGVEITPAYWRTFNNGKPESQASTVEASNNFYKRWLLNASAHLASTVRRDIPVVSMRSGVFGLKCRSGAHVLGCKTRYNKHLQRHEVWVAKLQVRQHRTKIEDDSALLQYFTEEPDPFTKWESGFSQRPVTKIRPGWVALQDVYEEYTS